MLYRNYENLYTTLFVKSLENICEVYDVFDYYSFGNVFMNTLKQHGCMKRRINQNQYEPEDNPLRKLVMKRSTLEKIYCNNITSHSSKVCGKQRSYWSRLLVYQFGHYICYREKKSNSGKPNTMFYRGKKNFYQNVPY